MAPVTSTESSCNEGAPGRFAGQMDCGFKSHSAAYLMSKFKIDTCPRKQPHDWSCCIFKHPKERAARRSLQQHSYEAVMCSTMLHRGSCDKGNHCPMAHSVFEYHMHPDKFRTKLCTEGAECKRNFCFFAHSEAELRTVNRQPKQQQQQQQQRQPVQSRAQPPVAAVANKAVYITAAAGAAAATLAGQPKCSSVSDGAVLKWQRVTVLAAPALAVQGTKFNNNAAAPAAAIASPFALQNAAANCALSASSSTAAAAAAAATSTTAERIAANAVQLQLHQLQQQQQLLAATQLQLDMQAAKATEAAGALAATAAVAAPPAAAPGSMFQSAAASPMLQLSPDGSLFNDLSPVLSPYDSSSISAADLPNLGFSNSSTSAALIDTSPMLFLQQQQQPQSTFTPTGPSYLELLLACSSSTGFPLAFNSSNSNDGTNILGNGLNIGGQMTTDPAFCLSSNSNSNSFDPIPCMPSCELNTPAVLSSCAPDHGAALLMNGASNSSSGRINAASIGNGVRMPCIATELAAFTDATQLLQRVLLGHAGDVRF